ncbi:uncharacterized protein [Ptychodera flava]|uniref:uncharacterized protein isoform X1 n=1 Tax=Ptychodera flava TaxID=63121 RepID=UPI00396A4713
MMAYILGDDMDMFKITRGQNNNRNNMISPIRENSVANENPFSVTVTKIDNGGSKGRVDIENGFGDNTVEYTYTSDLETSTFYKTLKPLLLSMSFFGLYQCSLKKDGLGNAKRYFCTLYSMFVVLLGWANFARYVASFWLDKDTNEEYHVAAIVSTVWLFQCAANGTVCFYLCMSAKYSVFFQHFQRYCQSPTSFSLGLNVDTRWLRKIVLVFVMICLGFVTSNVACLLFLIYGPLESSRNETAIFLTPFDLSSHIAVQLTVIAGYVVASASWVFPIAITCVVSMQLGRQFTKLTENLSRQVKNGTQGLNNMEDFRTEHQHLSNSVRLADSIFAFLILLAVASNLPLACFLLFQLVVANHQFSILMSIMVGFWLLINFLNIGMISWSSAVMHEKAHNAEHSLHDIPLRSRIENHKMLQITLFISRLNGAPIAFTIWKLVPLTKPFILR